MDKIIIENQYFGCVNYFKILFQFKNVKIELFENFQKMSFRNRCCVVGSNGVINLTVPVIGGRENKACIRDVKINYAENWQAQHVKTLASCYGGSPFYAFYKDEIEKLITKRHDYLWDKNWEILNYLLKVLGNDSDVSCTDSFIKQYNADSHDCRDLFKPSNKVDKIQLVKYMQVFEHSLGFQPNMSILDLLFCEGPATKRILTNSL